MPPTLDIDTLVGGILLHHGAVALAVALAVTGWAHPMSVCGARGMARSSGGYVLSFVYKL